MLRWFTTARFARTHSPFREQRLVLFAKDDHKKKDPLWQELEAVKSGLPEAVSDTESTVSTMQSQILGQLEEAAPEQILQELKQQDDIIDVLSSTGTLTERSEDIAKKLGIEDPVEAAPEKRAEFVERLLEESSDEEVIGVIDAVRSRLSLYEESLRMPENRLKAMYRDIDDVTGLERTLEHLYRYEARNNGVAIDAELGNEAISPENVIEKIKLRGEYSAEQRGQIFESLRDIARAQKVRRSMGQRVHPVTTAEEMSDAKDRFVSNINDALNPLSAYADARINARAQILIQRLCVLDILDGDTFGKYGITGHGVTKAIGDTVISLQKIRREYAEENRAPIEDENGLIEARSAIKILHDIEFSLEVPPNQNLPRLLIEKRERELELETWALAMARRVYAINPENAAAYPKAAEKLKTYRGFFEEFKPGRSASFEARSAIRETTTRKMREITADINHLENNPSAFSDENLAEFDERVPDDDIQAAIAATRTELETVIPEILSKIDHPTARLLKIPQGIQQMKDDIELNLLAGTSGRVMEARDRIKRLQYCNQTLQNIADRGDLIVRLSAADYEKVAGIRSFGYYNYEDGHIYLNRERIEAERADEEEILTHEMGHAVVDAFRRTNVFPNILLDFHEKLKYNRTSSGESMDTLLVRRAGPWGISLQDPNAITNVERWKLMDELSNRCAIWNDSGRPEVDPDEQMLFELLLKDQDFTATPGPTKLTGGAHFEVHGVNDPPLDPNADHETGGTGSGEESSSYVDTALEDLETKVINTNAFLKAFPEWKGEFDNIFRYSSIEKEIEALSRMFRSGQYMTNGSFQARLKRCEQIMDAIAGAMEEIDREKSDLTHEGKTGSRPLWTRITQDITWLSIGDMIALFKETGEDIQRMWKRRGEQARNRVGNTLSKMISDKVPYLGRLKHEFERRNRESEETEVGVWEKGLEKIDSHILQHKFIPSARTPDQLKAILRLLSKKGRLDWNDTHLWKKLEEMSGYVMPKGPCLRNSMLRNQWLQKMMADIWDDNDLFEHLKAENDSGIESGRKHLDPTVEDLSAIGALRTELRKLLCNWDKVKAGTASKEEEVNPHLYEGLIFYAMRNGKMNMEEKFFYLVKGVDAGLLSIDRLRTFTGENFGILNSFPFIDFFGTGKHSMPHEIKLIADQITEKGVGADRYKPGAKMTAFLMNTVAFDKGVYDRCNKGLKRAENIDHEDVPMLITQVDYTGVEQIINFTSGSQAKVSAQAMMNGYVGYGSFMKYFGIKAKIGQPPISDRDIAKIATSIAAYSYWDNLTTRYSVGAPKTSRPSLSWEQINDNAPVSGPKKTKVYRDAMNKFVVDLCENVGLTEVNGLEIRDYIGLTRDRKTADLILDKYKKKFATSTDAAENKKQQDAFNKEALYKRFEAAPQEFADELRNHLTNNRGALLSVLKKHEEHLEPENDEFTYKNLKSFLGNGHAAHASANQGGGHEGDHGSGHGH